MENELRGVVDALPGLIWTTLPDGRCDFINKRWCDYTGLSLEEALGVGWQAAIHPDDAPGFLQGWQSIRASGAAGELEARLRRFSGEYRLFAFHTSPVTDASGRLVKWCGLNTDIEDQRRTEHALREQEHQFHEIVDGLPTIVVLMRPDGEFEHANRYLLDYVGATQEELKARAFDFNWRLRFHPDDQDEVMVRWLHSIATGDSYDYEARLRRADGVYRWVHIRGYPLRDAKGRIVLWYLLQADVDDRKRAETLLAGEKRLLEMVAMGRPPRDVIDGLCRLLDQTAEGCLSGALLLDRTGACVEHAVGPGLPPSYSEALAGAAVSCEAGPCGMAACLKTQVIVADAASDTRWPIEGWPALALAHGLRSCWSTPILSPTGESLGTFAIYRRDGGVPTPFHQELIQKLTHIASIAIERTRSGEALKRSEARKAAILDSALDCIVTIDHEGRITEFNPAAENTFGFRREEVVGKPLAEVIVPPSLREKHRRGLARYLAGGQPRAIGKRIEMTAVRADGGEFPVELTITRNPLDGPASFTGYLRDISDRKQAEEALGKVRSELAHMARVTSLGALTASIAHEVNQPLSGIITNASTCLRMLGADPPNVDGARETARRTIRDGNRASDVITRLRALFAKKGARAEAVDLNEAAREVIALSWSELHGNRVILRTEFAESLPTVTGDRVQLQQVILNLLLNASDAMAGVEDRARRLVIGTECDEGDCVRLTVRDTGEGFGPAGAEKVFEAFYTTKDGGMGIGLSVSRSIIESHQGRIWAAPNDGPGATFGFSIPRVPEVVAGPETLRTPDVADAGRIERIP
jgi:PAS domain S-box-containing protein